MSIINIDKRTVPVTARNKRIYLTAGTTTINSGGSSSSGGSGVDYSMLTANTIPVYDGTSLANSAITVSGTQIVVPNLTVNGTIWADSVGTQSDDVSLILSGWTGTITLDDGTISYNTNVGGTHIFDAPITVPSGGSAIWNATSIATANTYDLTTYKSISTLSTAVATSGTTETLLNKLLIPTGKAAVGSTYKIRLAGVSSSTGTLIFKVKVGANGTTADNQVWISTTSAAQVANAHAGVDVLVTVRSTTTAIADGFATAGAVVLPTLIGAAATATIATTANWYIDVTATCSVGTFTAQVCSIEEVK